MDLVIFGLPGGGKGTQGDLITERFGHYRISTGELLRQQVAMDTPLGRVAKAHMDSGELVPDNIIIAFVREQISSLSPKTALMFDGFPRTLKQNAALEKILDSLGRRIERVIHLSTPEGVVIQRMLARGRSDDTELTIRRRIKSFHHDTEPLLEYYRRHRLIREIDGVGSPDDIHERVVALMLLADNDRQV